MSYFVYILQCVDGTYYTGCTNNVKKRLKEHNTSKNGAHYTKIRRPVILKHTENFSTLSDARKRESQIKRWERKIKEQLWNAHAL